MQFITCPFRNLGLLVPHGTFLSVPGSLKGSLVQLCPTLSQAEDCRNGVLLNSTACWHGCGTTLGLTENNVSVDTTPERGYIAGFNMVKCHDGRKTMDTEHLCAQDIMGTIECHPRGPCKEVGILSFPSYK